MKYGIWELENMQFYGDYVFKTKKRAEDKIEELGLNNNYEDFIMKLFQIVRQSMIEPTVPLVLFYGTIFCFLVLCFALGIRDIIRIIIKQIKGDIWKY